MRVPLSGKRPVSKQMDLLDRHLADNQFLCGSEYTIADIAN